MELKNYQKNVMEDLSSYLNATNSSNDLFSGWEKYWADKDVRVGVGGVPKYSNRLPGVPHICMKVPTGGGKTFMACSSIRRIIDAMPINKPKFVVWLVPSDSILKQTIRTLSDINHPYRQRLDKDFSGRVGIYTKDMLLNGQNFSPDTIKEMLTICVLSYASLRINSTKKDDRKVYQENGNLFRFAEFFDDKSILLADTPDTALIQVIRYLSPITVVDESHNADSPLSVEMLERLNSSFVLELTATPRESSNIISYVDARELKKENMVKLPVVVFNRVNRQTVIQDAICLRNNLEKQAIENQKTGGNYIRPIVLFQAQPRINEDSETFEKIVETLVALGISREEIAVKTSSVDDIGDTDLLNPLCKIRYIITVNALKEGWDCPFAYILASLANKTSRVDVEQILGRILRQPYTKKHQSSLLNTSYVFTSSMDFYSTLDNIVVALNKSGFSKKDYRVAEDLGTVEPPVTVQPTNNNSTNEQVSIEDIIPEETNGDSFDDIDTSFVREFISQTAENEQDNHELSEMITTATTQVEAYTQEVENKSDNGFIGGELGDMLNQNAILPQHVDEIKDLRIPQFFIQTTPDLFGEELELLEPENLSEGFSLSGQDASISFQLALGEVYSVDIEPEGEAVPKYKRSSKKESEYIQKYLESIPEAIRIQQCSKLIAAQINKNNRYATSEIENYVSRIVSNMTNDELSAMEIAIPLYASKIQQKIESLEETYRAKLFKQWLDQGKIICKESYELQPVITASETTDSIPYSLYEAEKNDMNSFEKEVIDIVVSTDNIRWWHRIIERKDFRLNGNFNHYPDFMVMTKSGKLVLIETKGDYLDGDDSKSKLELGRKWQEHAGRNYRYFMVFKNKDLQMDGAYTLDEFAELFKGI